MVKHYLALVIAVFSLVFMTSCNKSTGLDEDDSSVKLNVNAGSLDNHPGANTPIKDSTTAAMVGSTVQSQSMQAGSKAISLMGMSKIKASSLNGNIDGSISGTSSGTATAKGTYNYNQTDGSIVYDIICTFNNYSDDGKLFMGGQIHYLIDVSYGQTTDEVSGIYEISGKIRFNGSYIGTNTFSLDYNLTKMSYSYSSTIVSDGVTTTVNLTYP